MAAEEKCVYLTSRGHYSSQGYPPRRDKETGTAQNISISKSVRKGTGNINDLWFFIMHLFDQIGILA